MGLIGKTRVNKVSNSHSCQSFTTGKYSFNDKATALRTRKVFLENCESYRQDTWELLVKEIKKAIKDRTEQDDDKDFD